MRIVDGLNHHPHRVWGNLRESGKALRCTYSSVTFVRGAAFGSILGFLRSVTLSSFSFEKSVILLVTGIVGLLYSFHELGLAEHHR